MQIIFVCHDIAQSDRLEQMVQKKLEDFVNIFDMVVVRADAFFEEKTSPTIGVSTTQGL